MSRKTPAVAFINRLIKTTGRQDLQDMLNNTPLTSTDTALLLDYVNGATYKELAIKYNKSPQRIYQWKRTIYEKLHFFYTQKL